MRRRKTTPRDITPDAKYHSVLVARIIDYLMLDGKKSIVEVQFYSALDMVQEKLKRDPLQTVEEVIAKLTPTIEVSCKRVGGATYQIPMEVKERRGVALALKWFTISVRKQSGKSLAEKVFKAICDVLNATGWACKKKEEVFKMAEANKAFAHYGW